METIGKNSGKKAAFTIIELLTVMSIIIILISILVPSLNMVRRYSKRVKQKNQFYSIGIALELFNNEWEGYPDSEALDSDDPAPQQYCGAMKLAEALVGQDLKGFHPDSRFTSDGKVVKSGVDVDLYPQKDFPTPIEYAENLKARRGPYVQLENANAYRLQDLYTVSDITSIGQFDPCSVVLCDVYTNIMSEQGKRVGMPILYYRANLANNKHDADPAQLPTATDDKGQIYDYLDNDKLVQLAMPWNGFCHPIASVSGGKVTSTGGQPDATIFYEKITNEKIITGDRPHRSDSYILLSAGFDGEYGTRDDVFNFGD